MTQRKADARVEVWMLVRDHRKIARLMVIQDVSVRGLSRAAGWNSHSYLARILRGEVNTLKPEPAVLIAKTLGVPVDDLFLTKSTTIPGRTDKRVANPQGKPRRVHATTEQAGAA